MASVREVFNASSTGVSGLGAGIESIDTGFVGEWLANVGITTVVMTALAIAIAYDQSTLPSSSCGLRALSNPLHSLVLVAQEAPRR